MARSMIGNPIVLLDNVASGSRVWGSGSHSWVHTDGTYEGNTDPLSLDGLWFEIPVGGADILVITGAITVGTVAVASTCSSTLVQCAAVGMPYVDPSSSLLDKPECVRNLYTLANMQVVSGSQACVCTGYNGVVGRTLNSGSNLATSGLFIGDGSTVTEGDHGEFTFQLASQWCNTNGAGVASTNYTPRCSGLDTIWLAVKFVPTLLASVTAEVYTTLLALRYAITTRSF